MMLLSMAVNRTLMELKYVIDIHFRLLLVLLIVP